MTADLAELTATLRALPKRRVRYERHTGTMIERFMAKVHPEPNTGCWLWEGWIDSDGYSRFSINGKHQRAARVSYMLHKGEIPAGLQIDHKCRFHPCVNPDHLEAVTSRENTMRGDNVAAVFAKRTHCNHGHEFTPENTLMRSGGRGRLCRECKRIDNHKHHLRRPRRLALAGAPADTQAREDGA